MNTYREETHQFNVQSVEIQGGDPYGDVYEIGDTANVVMTFARNTETEPFFADETALHSQRLFMFGGSEIPLFTAVIVSATVAPEVSQFVVTCSVEFYTEFKDTDDIRNSIEVVSFTTPHIGRRGRIVMAVAERLNIIKLGTPVGKRLAWRPDTGKHYPISVKCVLLEPLQPIALDRDNLLPALIVQYGDGTRRYRAQRGRNSSFNTLNEYEEVMMINVRAVLRPSLEATQELAKQGILTGEALTIAIANLHEAIDAALGDGLDLSFKGTRIEGIRELVTMKWTTPFDMWASDYAILDIPVQITHVVARGEGV